MVKKVTNIYFYLLSFSPLLAFFQKKVTDVDYYSWMSVFTLMLFCLFFAECTVTRKRIKTHLYMIPLLFTGLYVFIWGFFNGVLKAEGVIGHIINNDLFVIAAALIILENTDFDKKLVNNIFFIIKASMFIACFFTFLQIIYKPYFAVYPSYLPTTGLDIAHTFFGARRKSMFGYLHRLGVGVSFVPIFATFLSVNLLNKVNMKKYVLYVFCASIVCFGSNARWVMLNFIVVIGMVVFDAKNKIHGFLKYFLVGCITVLFFAVFIQALGFDFSSIVEHRLKSGDQGRLHSLQVFSAFFKQNPIFGRGYHITSVDSYALSASGQIHIGYLAHLDQWGLVGSLFRFSFWFMFLCNLWRGARKSKFYGAFFAFVTFLLANITLVHYSLIHYGILLSFMFHQYFLAAHKDNRAYG